MKINHLIKILIDCNYMPGVIAVLENSVVNGTEKVPLFMELTNYSRKRNRTNQPLNN